MKKSLYLILLILISGNIYKATAQTKYCLTESQLDSIYIGLKQGEQLKKDLKVSNSIALELNTLLHASNDSLNKASEEVYDLNYRIYELQNTMVKNAPVAWYKKWWLWGAIGLVTGLIIK